MTTIKISNLVKYRDNGWEWNITTVEPYSEETEASNYRTNGEGDGLWIWNESNNEYRQILGHCQFSLPTDRAAAYAKIRRHFNS